MAKRSASKRERLSTRTSTQYAKRTARAASRRWTKWVGRKRRIAARKRRRRCSQATATRAIRIGDRGRSSVRSQLIRQDVFRRRPPGAMAARDGLVWMIPLCDKRGAVSHPHAGLAPALLTRRAHEMSIHIRRRIPPEFILNDIGQIETPSAA